MLTQDQIEAKVEGVLTAFSKMTPKEREMAPTGNFGDEYNKLIDEVLKAFPDLKEALPPKVEVFDSIQGAEVARIRYVELNAYYQQILNLLP